MNPCAGVTDLLVFEARPFSRLGTPPLFYIFNTSSLNYLEMKELMEKALDYSVGVSL